MKYNLAIAFILFFFNYMINSKLEKLKSFVHFTYNLLSIQFPNDSWRSLFKQCSSQRLFLPKILHDIDAVLYIDSDVLMLSSISEIWSFFDAMNSTQIAGLAYESEDFSSNWYYRFAQHPYYPPYGLNSGVMLMNLTKMRQFDWIKRTEEIYRNFRNKIVWGDQDIINIIFSENQDRIHLFGCNWNYRPDHCVYGLTCRRAVTEGIKILHGNRDSFVGSKQPAFKFIFEYFENFDFKTIERQNSSSNVISIRKGHLRSIKHSRIDRYEEQTSCHKLFDLIF